VKDKQHHGAAKIMKKISIIEIIKASTGARQTCARLEGAANNNHIETGMKKTASKYRK